MAIFGLSQQDIRNGEEHAMMNPYIPDHSTYDWFFSDIPFDVKIKLFAAVVAFCVPWLRKSASDKNRKLDDLLSGAYPLKFVVWRWGVSVRFLASAILFLAASDPLAQRPTIAMFGTIICIYSYIWMGICWKTANVYDKQQQELGTQKRWLVMLIRGYIMWVALSSLGLLNLWFANG